MARSCTFCDSSEHTAFNCRLKPRKALATTKPMNKIGRVGKETAKAVAQWKRTQEPNHQGYFVCYMCSKWVTYLEAEHVKSKARHPELRKDPTNFKPTCDDCNEQKRSKDE